MHTVNYLRVVNCEHDSVNRAERKKGYRKKGYQSNKKHMKGYLCTMHYK